MTDDSDPETLERDQTTDTGVHARVDTDHGDARTATRLARALRPDNTAEMETTTEDGRVVTDIWRDRPASLQSTVDDYVVNLQVGARLLGTTADTSGQSQDGPSQQHGQS